MKPISAISKQTANSIQGIAFDVDDTVTRHGNVESAAYEAIWKLHNQGLRLAAATGRPIGMAQTLAKLWPIHLAVGENGAGYAYANENEESLQYIGRTSDIEQSQKKLRHIEQQVANKFPHIKLSKDHTLRHCDLAFDIGEYETVPENEKQQLEKYLRTFEANVVSSSVHMHAYFGTRNKALALQAALKERLNISKEQAKTKWAYIGDSRNDESAFEFFDHSIGVSNVKDHMDKMIHPPKYITQQDRGKGFTEFVTHFLQLRNAR